MTDTPPPRKRSIRDTALYDTFLVLEGVLLGLALFKPFDLFASDVVKDPLRGDWTLRILFVGLVVRAILYFHAMIGEVMLTAVASDDESERSRAADLLPGTRHLVPAFTAMSRLWVGAVPIVLFFIAGEALDRGMVTFLAWFGTYVLYDLLWEISYLTKSSNRTIALEQWRELAHAPGALVRRLLRERRVPASEADVDVERGVAGDPATARTVQTSWINAAWWWSWLDAGALLFYGALIAVLLVWAGVPETAAAVVWLAVELALARVEWRLFPQLFAL